MLHYFDFDLSLVFYNFGRKTFFLFLELDKRDTIYVTKTALNQFNSILFLLPRRFRVLHLTPLRAGRNNA